MSPCARHHRALTKRTAPPVSPANPLSPLALVSDPLRQRRQFLQGALAASLPLGLLSCAGDKQQKVLGVGGLPVTCNLTLPIACVARAAANAASPATQPRFAYEYGKYGGWPEIMRWRVRSRIYRWYGELALLERDVATRKDAPPIEKWLLDLDRIGVAVEGLKTPAKFASEKRR